MKVSATHGLERVAPLVRMVHGNRKYHCFFLSKGEYQFVPLNVNFLTIESILFARSALSSLLCQPLLTLGIRRLSILPRLVVIVAIDRH